VNNPEHLDTAWRRHTDVLEILKNSSVFSVGCRHANASGGWTCRADTMTIHRLSCGRRQSLDLGIRLLIA